MAKQLRSALTVFLFLSFLSGALYPLVVTGIASVAFPSRAHGSLIVESDRAIGSDLIGQPFETPEYFWPRPSATGTGPYNALASGGSNQGPLNPALLESVKQRISALRAADPTNAAAIPVDLVSASASGLDPHISRAAADFQSARVARARGVDESQVRALIERHTSKRWLGVFGEQAVHVLRLNMALDDMPSTHGS